MGKSSSNPSANRQNDDRQGVEIEEFIPYTCHYNNRTILTENGELMQVIKVTGFAFETVKKEGDTQEKLTLRRAIRQAVADNIKTNNFSLWFHTVRRKRSLATEGTYVSEFPNSLNDAWVERHDWTNKYINELYVSILIEGESFSPKDVKTMARSLYYPLEARHQTETLGRMSQELDYMVNNVLKSLQAYGARRLEVVKGEDGIYYSEITGFLGKIVNLKETPTPLAMMDLGVLLPSHKISFGYNALEVTGETGTHFGALLTVKEYREISTDAVDEFLQLPLQYIVTETFDFVNNAEALKHFEDQQKILRISGDETVAEESGLNEIMKCDTGCATDFGEHQITIMVLQDNLELLEKRVGRLEEGLRDLGIVVVREDIFMEDCYWSQLPGNFAFIKRMAPINTRRIGGYASLYNFPAGKLRGNHWGPAVTVFYTAAGTPYFFNFHHGDNGHAVIVGPYGAGKTVLLNFLLSQAQKFKPRLVFIDQGRGAEVFLRAIGGSYHRVVRNADKATIRFNPLLLEDKQENRQFLYRLFCYMILGEDIDASEEILTQEETENIYKAIELSYSLPLEERRLSRVIPDIWGAEFGKGVVRQPTAAPEDNSVLDIPAWEELQDDEVLSSDVTSNIDDVMATWGEDDPMPELEAASSDVSFSSVAVRLSRWYGDGEYAHVFDNVVDQLDFSQGDIHGLGVTHMVEDRVPMVPVVFYLLYRMEEMLDGSPAICVLDEAWELMDNPAFAPRISGWLDRMRAKNAVVIFATESVENAKSSAITRPLMEYISTQIFLPNAHVNESYQDVFGLTGKELKLLSAMNREKRQFLLKHHVDSVVAELDLSGMHYLLSVLSSNPETLALMEQVIAEVGENPQQWLPLFKQRCESQ